MDEILCYLVFCFCAYAVSSLWMTITEEGQMLGWVQNGVLLRLAQTKYWVTNELLYKALGGCGRCNCLWTSILLYPAYAYLASAMGLDIQGGADTYFAFWVLSPAIANFIYNMNG